MALAFVAVFFGRLRPARADVTSWLMVGGGLGSLSQDAGPSTDQGIFQTELGIGTPASGAVVVGGIGKTMTFFSRGTDLLFGLRGASGGFARGGWGFAVDAGSYARLWGEDSFGFAGALVLGAPFGLEAAFHVEEGTNGVRTYAGVVGIDFLRLTVYRTKSQNYWPNPFPAFREQASR